ncbi:hypothetical protein ACVNIS_18330 [Sphaerotilaceae bacterium SBD11-9]
MQRHLVLALSISAACALAACGGGNASVGGTVSGLPSSTSVTLQLNAANDLTVSANGSFAFGDTVAAGGSYAVTVLTQPVGASCAVTNASGTIDTYGNDVSSVAVTCTSTATIAGTVSGLGSGRSLTLVNGSSALVVAGNGAFAFPGVLAGGTAYAVTVSVQPYGQSCTVSNGSGTVVSGAQTAIVVSCT